MGVDISDPIMANYVFLLKILKYACDSLCPSTCLMYGNTHKHTGISGSRHASATTDHALGELYETPQTQDEGEAVYDAPSPENGGATNAKEASTTFAKFDNPLYEDN